MKKLYHYCLKISFLVNIENVVHLELMDGEKHKTVDYVFLYSPYYLFMYHSLVMDEMEKRGYNVSSEWKDKNYRGKKAESYNNIEEIITDTPIYKEHNNEYLIECIENLRKKGIELEV